jgi:hypothetical protein
MATKCGIRRSLAVLVLAAITVASGAFAERVRVPGTTVSLNPPPGFTPAERFPGFQEVNRGASIMVTELPGPASKMQRGMTRETLATRGMSLLQAQDVVLSGGRARLLRVSQRAQGSEFIKWMLIAGDADGTVMVVGTFPKSALDLSGPIKRAVLSTSWSGGASADPFEGLPFRVTPTADLRLAKRVGNMLVFSATGEIGAGNPDQAIFVVGSSLSDVVIDSLEEFSKERASKTAQVGALRSVRGRNLEVDGLRGYELLAETDDPKSNRPVSLYQLLLVDDQTYYIAQGLVGEERGREFLPAFRGVAESFRRVGPHGER